MINIKYNIIVLLMKGIIATCIQFVRVLHAFALMIYCYLCAWCQVLFGGIATVSFLLFDCHRVCIKLSLHLVM